MSDSQFDLGSDLSDDLVGKIVQASTFESEGKTSEAIAVYQEISELDPTGNYGDVAREALANLEKTPTVSTAEITEHKKVSWWSSLSIKAKTSFVLIGIALSSSIGINTVAYILTNETVTEEMNSLQQAQSETLTKEIALFMRDRRNDIEALSNLGVLADPELRAKSTQSQKRRILNKYLDAYGVYNSIAVYDAEGELIVNSEGKPASNHKDKIYFQEAVKSDQAFIGQPRLSTSSGTYAVYTSAPIKDTKTGALVGVIRARMLVESLQDTFASEESSNAYMKAYILDANGQVFLTSDQEKQKQLLAATDQKIPLSEFFDFYQELTAEWNRQKNNVVQKQARGGRNNLNSQNIFYGENEVGYFNSLANIKVKSLDRFPDLGWSTVISIDNDFAFATQRKLLQVFVIGTIVAGLIVAFLARLIIVRATKPLIEAAEAVDKLGQGNFDVRVPVSGEDELADLGNNINKMAGQIQDLLHTQEAEAKNQRVEKEKLQRGVMGLLLDVEGAKKGDLTVRAEMSDGAVGSIADAFNSTLKKLQGLLQEVQNVSTEVGQLSHAGEGSVKQLSESALVQAAEIDQALISIDEINQSVKTIADYAQEAATIARSGSIQAKEGDLAMDATVDSIEKIRTTVANTSKKVKQLAESSQEIAQIVEIISGISEKTNLLAFNASVEAARAGEHGEGFRIVAEEVRRLADRITGATKDIQGLVTTIQQDTTLVLQGMETSTTEVVNGSELVRMTKLNLRSLAQTSEQIDEYLKSISTNTTKQTDNSKQINEKINGIALVAKNTSTEAQSVVQSLQTLVQEAQTLQTSVSQFKLQD